MLELLAGAHRAQAKAKWLGLPGSLAQEVDDREELQARIRRLNHRNPADLMILESADFRRLNGGYLIVTPAPFADRESAEAAREQWWLRATNHVKQAWPMPDPCQDY